MRRAHLLALRGRCLHQACCKIWWGEKWIKKEKEDAAFFANGGAVDGLRDSEKAMWKGEGGRGTLLLPRINPRSLFMQLEH